MATSDPIVPVGLSPPNEVVRLWCSPRDATYPDRYRATTRGWPLATLVHHYTRGMCGVLGDVLAERCGFEPWGTFDGDAERKPLHVVALDPGTGLFVDGNGEGQDEATVLGRSPTDFRRLAPLGRTGLFPRFLDPPLPRDLHYEVCREEHLERLLPDLFARTAEPATRGP